MSFGPLRLNFSKSGVGVSAGVRGARIGTGPRGAYVSLGAGGLYYRTSLSPGHAGRGGTRLELATPATEIVLPGDSFTPVSSSSIADTTDSSAAALLAELKRLRERIGATAPTAIIAFGAAALAVSQRTPPEFLAAIGAVAIVAMAVAAWVDHRRGRVRLEYELDVPAAKAYEALLDGAKLVGGADLVRLVRAKSRVVDRKRLAGAAEILQTTDVRLTFSAPSRVESTAPVIALPVDDFTIHFFPDRVLLYGAKEISALRYVDLHAEVTLTRFIEHGRVPRDASQVGQTLRYVNKNGEPDRRYRNNPEVPIMQYAELVLRDRTSDWRVTWQISSEPAARLFAAGIDAMRTLHARLGASDSGSTGEPSSAVKPPTTEPPMDAGPQTLRRGQTAAIIEEGGPAWEYKAFSAALIDVMADPPAVTGATAPTTTLSNRESIDWAVAQIDAYNRLVDGVRRIIDHAAPEAFGLPGPGTPRRSSQRHGI